MYKTIIILLSLLLFFLLVLTALFLFVFSDFGNATMKPYLREQLEKKIGMPVEIKAYRLRAGSLKLNLLINGEVHTNIVSRYDLWRRSFDGVYHIVTDHFAYGETKFQKVDIRGRFKGIAEDICLDGKGVALNAPITYRLRLINGEVRQVEASMRGLSLAEVLELAKQPPLAKGKADLEINMPSIGKQGAKGYAKLSVNKALFDYKLIKKYYHYSLPKESYFSLQADAVLSGNRIVFSADGKSNLFRMKVHEGVFHTEKGTLRALYEMDVKEMRILTENKLSGPFSAVGKVEVKDKRVQIAGESHSLGGTLMFNVGEHTKIDMTSLSMAKILRFVKQPAWMDGVLHGKIRIDDKRVQSGSYVIDIEEGKLNAKVIKKVFKYKIGEDNNLILHSEGKIKNKIVQADTKVRSTVADIVLQSMKYDINRQRLVSKYDVKIHSAALPVRGSSAQKRKAIILSGNVEYDKTISIRGEVKGLGKKVAFAYDGVKGKLDALQFYADKVLGLMGLPVYVKGAMDAKVNITNLKHLDGTFYFKGKTLTLQPEAMQKLTGKSAKMKLSLAAKGVMKEHMVYADAAVKMLEVGDIHLKKIVADTKQISLSAQYHLDIPDLARLYALTGFKFYGPLILDGKLSRIKQLKVTGNTGSLGGSVNYTLIGDQLRTNIEAVPLLNILKFMGYPQSFLGKASGKAVYNMRSQTGVANLNIASFQIKPSALTEILRGVLGKDPARIIFSSTTLHANIKGDEITYTLYAKGTRSAIEITKGRVNKRSKMQSGRLKFVYEGHTVYGKITGTIDHPKIVLDAGAILKEKFGNKLREKMEKKWGEGTGSLLKGLGL